MKFPNYFKNLKKIKFALFFCFLFTMSGMAQNGPGIKVVRTNWVNSMIPLPNPDPTFEPFGPNICVLLFSDNELHIQLTATVALPNISGHPEMFIEYDFGGIYGTTPIITNNDLVPYNYNGTTIYQAHFIIVLDMSSYCINPANIFSVNYEYSLRTPGIPYSLIYPIHNYSAPGQLFDKSIFEEADNGTDPLYVGNKDICCPEVKNYTAYDQDVEYAEAITNGQRNTIENNASDNSINVYPTVFSDKINIELAFEQNENTQLTIRDLMGQELYNKRYNQVQFINEALTLPAHLWAKGMYLLSIDNNHSHQTIKLLKQ